ncbi:hypothetical protein Tco_0034083 [Tanacetum coccineum]
MKGKVSQENDEFFMLLDLGGRRGAFVQLDWETTSVSCKILGEAVRNKGWVTNHGGDELVDKGRLMK